MTLADLIRSLLPPAHEEPEEPVEPVDRAGAPFERLYTGRPFAATPGADVPADATELDLTVELFRIIPNATGSGNYIGSAELPGWVRSVLIINPAQQLPCFWEEYDLPTIIALAAGGDQAVAAAIDFWAIGNSQVTFPRKTDATHLTIFANGLAQADGAPVIAYGTTRDLGATITPLT